MRKQLESVQGTRVRELRNFWISLATFKLVREVGTKIKISFATEYKKMRGALLEA